MDPRLHMGGLRQGGQAEALLEHKITPPHLEPRLERSALLDRVGNRSLVVLAAPSGYGKTMFALELARHTEGPVAWFCADENDRDIAAVHSYVLRALARAWPDLEPDAQVPMRDEGALARLAYALDALSGPGCIIVDDLHCVPERAAGPVVSVLLEAAPPGLRLVVCSRSDPPADLLSWFSSGRGIRFDASDLAFDRREVATLVPVGADDTYHRTGGWPLAVGLAAESPRSSPGIDPAHQDILAARALEELSTAATAHLASLAELPGFPEAAVVHLLPETVRAELDRYRIRHPSLIHVEQGWWTIRDVLRDHLRTATLAALDPDAVADVLREEHPVLAVHLLQETRRWHAAATLLEDVVDDLVAAGRHELVHELVERMPETCRSDKLRFAVLLGDVMSDAAKPSALGSFWQEMHAAGSALAPAAAVLHAHSLIAQGDATGVAVVMAGLQDLLGEPPTPARVRRALSDPAVDPLTLGYLAGLCATVLLQGTSDADRENADTFISVAESAFDRAGLDPALARGPYDLLRAITGAISAHDAIGSVEKMAVAHRRVQSPFLGWALLALLLVQVSTRNEVGARRTVAEAALFAEANGARDIQVHVSAFEALIDLSDGAAADALARIEELWPHILDTEFSTAVELSVTVGNILIDHGLVDEARIWLARARTHTPREVWTTWRREALELRMRARDGTDPETVDAAAGLIERFAVAGRPHGAADVASALTTDLAETGREDDARLVVARCRHLLPRERHAELAGHSTRHPHAPNRKPAPQTQDARQELCLLGPQIDVVRGTGSHRLSGLCARLLALLVVDGGTVERDRALEILWPNGDPATGRDRLYTVLHRLRRALGYSGDRELYTQEGMVHFHADHATDIDVWRFRAALRRASTDRPAELTQAVLAFHGDFCTKQFAYDDFAIEARRDLRSAYHRVALAALQTHLRSGDTAAAETAALHVADHGSDYEELTLLAVEALAATGHRDVARDLLDTTVLRICELGYEPVELLERGRAITAAP